MTAINRQRDSGFRRIFFACLLIALAIGFQWHYVSLHDVWFLVIDCVQLIENSLFPVPQSLTQVHTLAYLNGIRFVVVLFTLFYIVFCFFKQKLSFTRNRTKRCSLRAHHHHSIITTHTHCNPNGNIGRSKK